MNTNKLCMISLKIQTLITLIRKTKASSDSLLINIFIYFFVSFFSIWKRTEEDCWKYEYVKHPLWLLSLIALKSTFNLIHWYTEFLWPSPSLPLGHMFSHHTLFLPVDTSILEWKLRIVYVNVNVIFCMRTV